MNKLLLLFLSLVTVTTSLLGQDKNYIITDFGAINNKNILSTEFIQSAIDEAHKNGGGTVVFPAGEFLSGTIFLKSNVDLHLKKGATLFGSTNIGEYKKSNGNHALLVAYQQKNIAITGEGTIDGQGQKLALAIDSLHHSGIKEDPSYNYRRMRPNNRPNLIKMSNCENIKLTGINANNAATWVLRFDKCNMLEIDNVNVYSDAFWNNDGIDLEDCKNARITNCNVNSADDGICLKSNDPESFCDKIYIANNTVRSSASAIKFGTASAGGFKNVTIENIKIYDTFRSALAFEAVDGGTIENVTATNITATNTGNAVFIRLGHRNVDGKVGTIKNVKIKNMVVDIPFGIPDIDYNIRGPQLPFFHNPFPASICGIPGHYVEDVSLENIEISYPGRANEGYAHVALWNLDIIPENESEYPEFSMFGELPSWGFYVRHVNGLELKNVRINVRKKDFRPAYVFDDVKNLKLEGGNISSPTKTSQVVVKDTDGVEVNNLKVDWKKITTVPAYGENSNVSGVELDKKE